MINEGMLQTHYAFPAVDEGGNGYVVLDPIDARDVRLERLAVPLRQPALPERKP